MISIDEAVPVELDVNLTCDNLSAHMIPAISDWLARHPRYHLHFASTGSSWINQVESWFGYPTDQLLRRGSARACRHKTAEEILDSLARYVSQISGAGQSSPPRAARNRAANRETVSA